MTLNLSTKHEVVSRAAFHYVYLEKTGPFAEVAPSTWEEFSRLLGS